jgi:hypothetical protein
VNFWQVELASCGLARRTGVLDPRDRPKYFTCIAFSSSGNFDKQMVSNDESKVNERRMMNK